MAAKKKAEVSWGRRLLTAAWMLLFLALAAAYGATYILPPLGPMPEHQELADKSTDTEAMAADSVPSEDTSEQMATADASAGDMSTEAADAPKMTSKESDSGSTADSGSDTQTTEDAPPETPRPPEQEATAEPTPETEDKVAAKQEETEQDASPVKELKGTEKPKEDPASTPPEGDSASENMAEVMAARPVEIAPSPMPAPAPTPAPEPEVDRRPPWQRFAQPFSLHPQKPKIAIVIYSLGLSNKATEQAVRQLPREITLSFSPYARKLEGWVSLARARGHEAMIDLPLEPVGYPASDPGHFALLTSNSVAENLQRLDDVTGSSSAFVGLTAFMGSRFSSSSASMEPVVKAIADRGLLYLDNGQVAETVTKGLAPNYGLAYLVTDRVLDGKSANRLTIDARLAQLERLALTTGRAIGLARPFPVTIERLKVWSKKLESRGIQLVPITQMVKIYNSPAEIKGAPDPNQTITIQKTDDLG
ncbi:divergent polysaccharide deacetylase family protein [Rhodovibrionaceae bacterium A322]